jgi:hypothetical protein
VLLWDDRDHPGLGEQLVNLPEELDKEKFYKLFLNLMAQPAPERATPLRSAPAVP